MPTYTNYNNYIKAKANSAVCCTSAGKCIGGGNSGSDTGSGTNINFDNLTIGPKHHFTTTQDDEKYTVTLNDELFLRSITLSNETLKFADSNGKIVSLGFKKVDQSYNLYLPKNIPSDSSGCISYR